MNPKSFKSPDSFVPERWIAGNDEYASDNKQGFQPFSFGPRMCLGKNMAYHEIRLILAKLFYNFDLELCEESRVWNKQKVFLMWDKGPLYCRVRERV
ncbi:hypothetical protein WHR41_09506 [Cladosporium halotolerans]|uniref:Cytochrome P450 n=1 Tax=Cladosporium halotolerans TaxID=1052096 RepID=A0AB34KB26_9PEZI